ncbi:hypothetical protein BD410DRAFT_447720 [Rickenella mellea]|uniref:Uncharacterized protein n=1 Tax=Rickenella mellea TaxID=50990 RepID=A0A4Y7PVX7_9AGAM|nr:hypothetical protein BD410DRAFT_447720 [Rickenella mellea]
MGGEHPCEPRARAHQCISIFPVLSCVYDMIIMTLAIEIFLFVEWPRLRLTNGRVHLLLHVLVVERTALLTLLWEFKFPRLDVFVPCTFHVAFWFAARDRLVRPFFLEPFFMDLGLDRHTPTPAQLMTAPNAHPSKLPSVIACTLSFLVGVGEDGEAGEAGRRG